jgi:Predicted pyridoxal phosphate-dependent enzyme apparently involved in regulation of cell wall biogenesis
MTEFQAAVGIAQLRKLDRIVETRREMAKLLDEKFTDFDILKIPVEKEWSRHTYWKYPFKVDMSSIKADMDTIAEALKAEGLPCWAGYTKVPIYMYNVLTIPYTYGKSGYPFVNNGYKYGEGLCPKAEKDLKEMIVVPFCEGYKPEHIELIAKAVKKVLDYYRA